MGLDFFFCVFPSIKMSSSRAVDPVWAPAVQRGGGECGGCGWGQDAWGTFSDSLCGPVGPFCAQRVCQHVCVCPVCAHCVCGRQAQLRRRLAGRLPRPPPPLCCLSCRLHHCLRLCLPALPLHRLLSGNPRLGRPRHLGHRQPHHPARGRPRLSRALQHLGGRTRPCPHRHHCLGCLARRNGSCHCWSLLHP